MTAPASLPALIAEGRRLIAAATYDSAEPWQFERNEEPDEVYYRDGTFDVIGSGLLASAEYPENEARARLAVFAVNNLAALLDVAEAAAEARAAETEPDDNVAPYPIGPRVCHEYGCPCTKIGKKFGPCDCGGAAIQERIDASRAALDSALSKLRGVTT